MILTLETEERQFLTNIIIDRFQDDARRSTEGLVLGSIFNKLVYIPDADFIPQEVGHMQFILQELGEIWGSRRSTANEKLPIVGPGMNFVAQKTLQLVKSVSDKLGAMLVVDTATPTDSTVANGEGSRGIIGNTSQGM